MIFVIAFRSPTRSGLEGFGGIWRGFGGDLEGSGEDLGVMWMQFGFGVDLEGSGDLEGCGAHHIDFSFSKITYD